MPGKTTVTIYGCPVTFDFDQFSIIFNTADYDAIDAIQKTDEYKLQAHKLISTHDAFYLGNPLVLEISSPIMINLSARLVQIYKNKVNCKSTVFNNIPSLAETLAEKKIIPDTVVDKIKNLCHKVRNIHNSVTQPPSVDDLIDIYALNGTILKELDYI